MPNPKYLSGVRFEREVMKEYEGYGFRVLRSAGSHGVYDVVAYHPERRTIFAQCKVVRTKTEGEKLVKAFLASPPERPSKFFDQLILVKVKGKGEFLQGTI